jgi:uncharacterized protein (TIGR02145 family)
LHFRKSLKTQKIPVMKKLWIILVSAVVLSDCSLFNKGEEAAPEIVNTVSSFVDSRDNEKYASVSIGDQVWMAENLNYSCDGSFYYKNNARHADFYGRLYTWKAALEACPEGWHLPTDDEWKKLEMHLGIKKNQVDDTEWRGSDQGKQLSVKGNAGFNVMMAGYRNIEGMYDELDEIATFWTASEHNKFDAWNRGMESGRDMISRRTYAKDYGFSVRCVKD